ncbi:hypothetical protein LUZ62_027097 [Rhynchospora pubera]|uniref:Uncharacterized protein n=1 Tax=Rhynchospora pubera TaxID=906938 RepID=A0AAV8HFV4_9POAL|nr:hypothetical protein LUZ62_027097 [Rhynchospora pubera]
MNQNNNMGEGDKGLTAPPIWADDVAEYAPSMTVVPFDPPLPLLRGPVPADPTDEPSSGPFVLAFPNKASWSFAYGAARSKIKEQCEAGVRVGCSISASNKCKPPWWRGLFRSEPSDLSSREECEEREMTACLALAKESCVKFSNDKCLVPFRDARIAKSNLLDSSGFVFWDPKKDGKLFGCKIMENEEFLEESRGNFEGRYYRGSVFLDTHVEHVDRTQFT